MLVGSSSLSEPWTIITEIQEGPGVITALEFGRSVCDSGVGGPRKVPAGRLFVQHRHLRHSVREFPPRVDVESWPAYKGLRVFRYSISYLLWWTCEDRRVKTEYLVRVSAPLTSLPLNVTY